MKRQWLDRDRLPAHTLGGRGRQSLDTRAKTLLE